MIWLIWFIGRCLIMIWWIILLLLMFCFFGMLRKRMFCIIMVLGGVILLSCFFRFLCWVYLIVWLFGKLLLGLKMFWCGCKYWSFWFILAWLIRYWWWKGRLFLKKIVVNVMVFMVRKRFILISWFYWYLLK